MRSEQDETSQQFCIQATPEPFETAAKHPVLYENSRR